MCPENERTRVVRASYRAFETGDRDLAERVFGEQLRFHAPPDPDLDRAGFFERCWPNAGHLEAFEFVRLFERGEQVFVTYEARRGDGTRFRNTEVLRFAGERIAEAEVYFGWTL